MRNTMRKIPKLDQCIHYVSLLGPLNPHIQRYCLVKYIFRNWSKFTPAQCRCSCMGIMMTCYEIYSVIFLNSLQWRHNGCDCVSNHLMVVYSNVYSGVDQRKHQSSTSLAFVRGIHRGPVNSPHKWPVTRKMSPFDDVIIMCPCVV